MRYREYYVIKCGKSSSNSNNGDDNNPTPLSTSDKEDTKKEDKEFWEDPEYDNYKRKFGMHFNDTLAVWASRQLKNKHGDKSHSWGVEEVKAAYKNLGLIKPSYVTWGDATYAANLTYATFFLEGLKTEIEVLKHSNAEITDVNNYASKTFTRWLSDIMGLNIKVSWGDFME